MKTLLLVLAILFIVSFLTILYMVKTAQPYPDDYEEDEELKRKFEEYKKSQK